MTPQTVRLAYKTGKTAYRTFKDYRNRKTAEAYDATSEVLNDAANTYHSLRASSKKPVPPAKNCPVQPAAKPRNWKSAQPKKQERKSAAAKSAN